jgi:hypothetical protein
MDLSECYKAALLMEIARRTVEEFEAVKDCGDIEGFGGLTAGDVD